MCPDEKQRVEKQEKNEENKSDRLADQGDRGGSAYLGRSEMEKASPSLRHREERRKKRTEAVFWASYAIQQLRHLFCGRSGAYSVLKKRVFEVQSVAGLRASGKGKRK